MSCRCYFLADILLLVCSLRCPLYHKQTKTNCSTIQLSPFTELMIDLGKKQQWIFRTIRHHNMDIFTILILPFNTQIRIQKKLLGIRRFSEGLKTEILGILFRYFARFLAIWASSHKPMACFIKNDPSFCFKGDFSNYLRRNFYFLQQKFYFLRENRKKFENSCKISWANDFELTWSAFSSF